MEKTPNQNQTESKILGIDLGTSNCSLAVAGIGGVDTLEITQVDAPSRITDKKTFASALYFPLPGQFPTGSLKLPWENESSGEEVVAGDFARETGALAPDRMVHSAKSWLSFRSVDPTKPLLPFNAESGERKISPLEASGIYLNHLKNAFLHQAKKETELSSGDMLGTQVVLTVPASFDEVARKLTARAATEAGLGEDVILLEEPQAAFYAWLDTVATSWREQIHPGDIVLVCDVGGGTTDFSLIAVSENNGNLELERISVGKHILLGGDNMDLALAFVLRHQLQEKGTELDDWQFQSLIHQARMAKEKLFESPDLKEAPIAIASRGSNLFAGTVSTVLTREMVETVVVDGFFSMTSPEDMPAGDSGAGLVEMGLPYEPDAVISKHLAAFLTNSLKNVTGNTSLSSRVNSDNLSGGYLRPDAVLFNGGVFKPEILRNRILELLQSWNREFPVRELKGANQDLAVARGAAVYGRSKITGKGLRIRAGASRSYYIGIEQSMPAIPGYKPPVKALCIVPQGMEEGTEHVLKDKEFGLMTGATVHFRFFGSPDRAGDGMGTVVADAEKNLEETSSLEMELPVMEGMGERSVVPVNLHSRLNELGTLELWMQRIDSSQRWELNFDVRTE